LAGRYYRTVIDKGILLYGFVGAALPSVVLALVLIYFFGIRWGWLPPIGSVDIMIYRTGDTFAIFMSRVQHLILPSLAMATFSGIGLMYTLRAGIVDGRSSDYAMTARSKGVPERVIFNKHILRNSLIPFAQGLGFVFISVFSGAVLIERIFRFPGMGDLFITSIESRDYGIVSGLVLFYSVLNILAVLIGDIALAATDPRIRVR
jgi:peptide/nickel transport system permease protein